MKLAQIIAKKYGNYVLMLMLLEDIVADLRLRASLSEEPNVLNISSSLLIRADKVIAKAKGEI